MDRPAIIKKISSYFETKEEVNTVYLFGSIAKGKDREKSDLDLGILFKPGLNSIERFEKNLAHAVDLEEIFNIPIDVIDLRSADPFFLHQIFLTKIIVLDKDPSIRVNFEVKSRKAFFDRQYFYQKYHEQALKRLERRALHD